ncbi:hypothetical protein [Streptomyces sp. NPDC007346]|uniref:hypothetical protein n=1 Tax=Streptomyces sp. NPDC007346 TaxID=3154682 RepID=UPI0034529CDA
MSTPGPRSKSRLVAAGYVALVTLAALAHEIAGRPESGEAAMLLAAWPGDTLLLVLVLYPLALLAGAAPATEEAGPSLLGPLLHGAGALVNVLIAWGVITFVRHFKAECVRSRGR